MDPLQPGFQSLVSTLTGVGLTRVAKADANAGFLALFRQKAGQAESGGQTVYFADVLIELFTGKTKNSSPDVVVAAILNGEFDPQSPFTGLVYSKLALALSFFVLTGMWSATCDPEAKDAVIPTPAAYTEGLIWLIAQTHPAGNSKMAAGSWAVPPPPLAKFIGT